MTSTTSVILLLSHPAVIETIPEVLLLAVTELGGLVLDLGLVVFAALKALLTPTPMPPPASAGGQTGRSCFRPSGTPSAAAPRLPLARGPVLRRNFAYGPLPLRPAPVLCSRDPRCALPTTHCRRSFCLRAAPTRVCGRGKPGFALSPTRVYRRSLPILVLGLQVR